MRKTIGVILMTIMLCGCAVADSAKAAVPAEKIEGRQLYVKKVDNLPDDFILGMDASIVIAEENSGVRYYNFNGEEQDVFLTMAESGINAIRVRVWNDPYDENGNGFGGGNNDIGTAVLIGKRASTSAATATPRRRRRPPAASRR